MDLKGSLPWKSDGNQFVIIMTNLFSRLTRPVKMSKTNATHKASNFMDHWFNTYCIADYVLTGSRTQFISKLFELLRTVLGTKHLQKASDRPKTNGNAERFKKTIFARLRNYMAEHQRDWNIYRQPLPYTYNWQGHRSASLLLSSLVLSTQPLGLQHSNI